MSELKNEDEVELNHIHDPQIKTKLKKVIKAYKPVKTESVDDASMKIALTDNVEFCQRARRLSLTEKQEVFR